ncbi:molecular chaperone [Enterobacteriaceae bacterium RIT702]|nr:molecular chaperone [Enterobacteriaceae bacterium RIT702]
MRKLLCMALLSACSMANAIPNINIGAMYEFIDGEQSTLSKRVRNQGDQTGYVRTEVSEIIYLSDGKKQERKIDAQAAAKGNVDGLIFTPSRMIIPAKGMQTGRLIVTGQRDKERYYRVRFIPVMPKDQYEFNQSKKEYDEYRNKLSAGVNVLTGYGAMVIVRPKNQLFNTQIESAGNSIIIKNSGNSSVKIEDVKQCVNKKCTEENGTILLPGKDYRLLKKKGNFIQFNLIEASKKTPKSFG